MSLGFQNQKYLDRGVGGWVELYPICLGFLEFVYLCKAPNPDWVKYMFVSYNLKLRF